MNNYQVIELQVICKEFSTFYYYFFHFAKSLLSNNNRGQTRGCGEEMSCFCFMGFNFLYVELKLASCWL